MGVGTAANVLPFRGQPLCWPAAGGLAVRALMDNRRRNTISTWAPLVRTHAEALLLQFPDRPRTHISAILIFLRPWKYAMFITTPDPVAPTGRQAEPNTAPGARPRITGIYR